MRAILMTVKDVVANADLATFNKIDESGLDKFTKLSNFEVSAIFLEYAAKNIRNNRVINAGRGNPNWINTTARLANQKLVNFGVEESKRTFERDDGAMAGFIEGEGVADRFLATLSDTDSTDQFLRSAFDYCVDKLGFDKDAFVKELLDGVIGNNYPVPSRALKYTEQILNAYLQKNLYKGVDLAGETDVFPTEGGTAAMVYLFQELKQSHILNPGDTIAINSPIFTPYLQIPELAEYNLKIVKLAADEDDNWQMTDEQMDTLKDPSIKGFFDVNPTNPSARAYSPHTLDKFKEVVEANPNLVVISDDVYGTFADDYQSIYAAIPHNTLLVYSFSKLYGATGQRLGLIAANKNNVCDRIIKEVTNNDKSIKDAMEERYSMVVPEPNEMKFIDRTVADSRAIGLYHTSGLSTPQQIMMDLFALNSLITDDVDDYLLTSKKVVNYRYHALWDEIGVNVDNSHANTKYYTLVDIYDLVEKVHGEEFGKYFRSQYSYLSFPYRLAKEFGAVVMDASGFGARKGYVRISLANLTSDDYRDLAKCIKSLIDEYYMEFQQDQKA